MNTNSNTLVNRVEIVFYSTLISCMSGVHRIRARIENLANFPLQPSADEDATNLQLEDKLSERSLINSWTYVSQALIQLLIWMILGFAAGFLIGMIRPR